jgi:hypothetical protein
VTDDLMKRGIAALEAGRKAEARTLLVQVLRQDKRNEMAWLWLSGAVDTDAERCACLEGVLALDPHNAVAQRGLEHLLRNTDEPPLRAEPSPAPRSTSIPASRQHLPLAATSGAAQDDEPDPASEPRVEVNPTTHTMKLAHTFVAQTDEDTARSRAATFLEQASYERVEVQPRLRYRRGDRQGWLRLVSPRGWYVEATIQATPLPGQSTSVTVTFDVDITDQSITRTERRFWTTEFDGLGAYVRSGDTSVVTSTKLARASTVQNIVACATVLVLSLGLATGARLLFASRSAFWIGGLLGMAIGIGLAKVWLRLEPGERP